MTQAPEREQTTTTEGSPQARVDAWLERFQAALDARDGRAAGALFATDSFWRDLVAFTWNLKTVEGAAGVADLVDATSAAAEASAFHTTEPPDEADGVVTAWIAFETGVGRGNGLLRLVVEDGEDRAFTLLTALYELKGFEEPRGTHRPMGAEHGANKTRQTWKDRSTAGSASRARPRSRSGGARCRRSPPATASRCRPRG